MRIITSVQIIIFDYYKDGLFYWWKLNNLHVSDKLGRTKTSEWQYILSDILLVTWPVLKPDKDNFDATKN